LEMISLAISSSQFVSLFLNILSLFYCITFSVYMYTNFIYPLAFPSGSKKELHHSQPNAENSIVESDISHSCITHDLSSFESSVIVLRTSETNQNTSLGKFLIGKEFLQKSNCAVENAIEVGIEAVRPSLSNFVGTFHNEAICCNATENLQSCQQKYDNLNYQNFESLFDELCENSDIRSQCDDLESCGDEISWKSSQLSVLTKEEKYRTSLGYFLLSSSRKGQNRRALVHNWCEIVTPQSVSDVNIPTNAMAPLKDMFISPINYSSDMCCTEDSIAIEKDISHLKHPFEMKNSALHSSACKEKSNRSASDESQEAAVVTVTADLLSSLQWELEMAKMEAGQLRAEVESLAQQLATSRNMLVDFELQSTWKSLENKRLSSSNHKLQQKVKVAAKVDSSNPHSAPRLSDDIATETTENGVLRQQLAAVKSQLQEVLQKLNDCEEELAAKRDLSYSQGRQLAELQSRLDRSLVLDRCKSDGSIRIPASSSGSRQSRLSMLYKDSFRDENTLSRSRSQKSPFMAGESVHAELATSRRLGEVLSLEYPHETAPESMNTFAVRGNWPGLSPDSERSPPLQATERNAVMATTPFSHSRDSVRERNTFQNGEINNVYAQSCLKCNDLESTIRVQGVEITTLISRLSHSESELRNITSTRRSEQAFAANRITQLESDIAALTSLAGDWNSERQLLMNEVILERNRSSLTLANISSSCCEMVNLQPASEAVLPVAVEESCSQPVQSSSPVTSVQLESHCRKDIDFDVDVEFPQELQPTQQNELVLSGDGIISNVVKQDTVLSHSSINRDHEQRYQELIDLKLRESALSAELSELNASYSIKLAAIISLENVLNLKESNEKKMSELLSELTLTNTDLTKALKEEVAHRIQLEDTRKEEAALCDKRLALIVTLQDDIRRLEEDLRIEKEASLKRCQESSNMTLMLEDNLQRMESEALTLKSELEEVSSSRLALQLEVETTKGVLSDSKQANKDLQKRLEEMIAVNAELQQSLASHVVSQERSKNLLRAEELKTEESCLQLRNLAASNANEMALKDGEISQLRQVQNELHDSLVAKERTCQELERDLAMTTQCFSNEITLLKCKLAETFALLKSYETEITSLATENNYKDGILNELNQRIISHQFNEDKLNSELLKKSIENEEKNVALESSIRLVQSYEDKVFASNASIVELQETLNFCAEELEQKRLQKVEYLHIINSQRGQLMDSTDHISLLKCEIGELNIKIELDNVVYMVEVRAIENELFRWMECHGMLCEELHMCRQINNSLQWRLLGVDSRELGVAEDKALNFQPQVEASEVPRVEEAMLEHNFPTSLSLSNSHEMIMETVSFEVNLLNDMESSECKHSAVVQSSPCSFDLSALEEVSRNEDRVSFTNEEKLVLLEEVCSMCLEDFQSYRIHVALEHGMIINRFLAAEKSHTDIIELLHCDNTRHNQVNNELMKVINEKDAILSSKTDQIALNEMSLQSEASQVVALSLEVACLRCDERNLQEKLLMATTAISNLESKLQIADEQRHEVEHTATAIQEQLTNHSSILSNSLVSVNFLLKDSQEKFTRNECRIAMQREQYDMHMADLECKIMDSQNMLSSWKRKFDQIVHELCNIVRGIHETLPSLYSQESNDDIEFIRSELATDKCRGDALSSTYFVQQPQTQVFTELVSLLENLSFHVRCSYSNLHEKEVAHENLLRSKEATIQKLSRAATQILVSHGAFYQSIIEESTKMTMDVSPHECESGERHFAEGSIIRCDVDDTNDVEINLEGEPDGLSAFMCGVVVDESFKEAWETKYEVNKAENEAILLEAEIKDSHLITSVTTDNYDNYLLSMTAEGGQEVWELKYEMEKIADSSYMLSLIGVVDVESYKEAWESKDTDQPYGFSYPKNSKVGNSNTTSYFNFGQNNGYEFDEVALPQEIWEMKYESEQLFLQSNKCDLQKINDSDVELLVQELMKMRTDLLHAQKLQNNRRKIVNFCMATTQTDATNPFHLSNKEVVIATAISESQNCTLPVKPIETHISLCNHCEVKECNSQLIVNDQINHNILTVNLAESTKIEMELIQGELEGLRLSLAAKVDELNFMSLKLGQLYECVAAATSSGGPLKVENDAAAIIDGICSLINEAVAARRIVATVQERDEEKDSQIAELINIVAAQLSDISTIEAILQTWETCIGNSLGILDEDSLEVVVGAERASHGLGLLHIQRSGDSDWIGKKSLRLLKKLQQFFADNSETISRWKCAAKCDIEQLWNADNAMGFEIVNDEAVDDSQPFTDVVKNLQLWLRNLTKRISDCLSNEASSSSSSPCMTFEDFGSTLLIDDLTRLDAAVNDLLCQCSGLLRSAAFDQHDSSHQSFASQGSEDSHLKLSPIIRRRKSISELQQQILLYKAEVAHLQKLQQRCEQERDTLMSEVEVTKALRRRQTQIKLTRQVSSQVEEL